MAFKIRKGKKEDLPRIMELVRELAEYEKGLHKVSNTMAMMEADGFGANPVFFFYVAVEQDGFIPGMALCYYRYSTWKGRRLYLEDIVVTESHRGQGIGKALFEKCLKEAEEQNCTGIVWQVLDWNSDAIEFYKKYGTQFDQEWVNCWIDL